MKQKHQDSEEIPKWWQVRRAVTKEAITRFGKKRKMINLCLGLAIWEYGDSPNNFLPSFSRHKLMVDVAQEMSLNKEEKKRMKEISRAYKKKEYCSCSLELVWRFT